MQSVFPALFPAGAEHTDGIPLPKASMTSLSWPGTAGPNFCHPSSSWDGNFRNNRRLLCTSSKEKKEESSRDRGGLCGAQEVLLELPMAR